MKSKKEWEGMVSFLLSKRRRFDEIEEAVFKEKVNEEKDGDRKGRLKELQISDDQKVRLQCEPESHRRRMDS